METEFDHPLYTAGQEIATFLFSCGILSKAWENSRAASGSESFKLNEYEGVGYVAFPSFCNLEGYIVEQSGYGECNIETDNRVFSACLKGKADQPARVHQGALKLFLQILENTDFQAQLQIYTDSKQKRLKPIVFVGHSLGGAVATLATLWVLEKRTRQSSPFCITFGCPLVGDVNLVEAVARENWGGNFCHVVSKNDIVPRMLLAPFESTAAPLTALLPYWWDNITSGRNDQPAFFIQDAYRALLRSVRESDTSPYKPFGNYMFSSSQGVTCIENSETILEMLRLTMQSQETGSDEIVQNCLLEHTGYGSVVEDVIQNSIRGTRNVNPNLESSFDIGILLQLEGLGFESQDDNAQLALRRALASENEHDINVDRLAIELSLKQSKMVEVECYKEISEKNYELPYYDSFKNQNTKIDFHADRLRLKLAEFWDDIIEMWENNELPRDFQSQNKWINAGNTYRKLVEPLDIAYYYRTNSNGNYLSDGRPNRHKVLQKWMEDKEKTRSSRAQICRTKLPSLTRDSCFWARLEEARKDLENLKQQQHEKLESIEMFEGYVTKLIKEGDISMSVFFQGSSFMQWWEEWKEYQQNQFPQWTSPLYEKMGNGWQR